MFETKKFMYRNQREPFQSLELLQHRTENVFPLVSQDNIQSAVDQWKDVLKTQSKKQGPTQYRFP
jgi:hypothetical protein